jgi:hypothetical protein
VDAVVRPETEGIRGAATANRRILFIRSVPAAIGPVPVLPAR